MRRTNMCNTCRLQPASGGRERWNQADATLTLWQCQAQRSLDSFSAFEKIFPGWWAVRPASENQFDWLPGLEYKLTRRATRTARKSWPPTPSTMARPRATSPRGVMSP